MTTRDDYFVSVSKDRFFAILGPINVHPRPERDRTFWETNGREVLGITTPGYMCDGCETYRVLAALAAREKEGR